MYTPDFLERVFHHACHVTAGGCVQILKLDMSSALISSYVCIWRTSFLVFLEKEYYMAHHTGPKARVNRRLGLLIFENSGAARALERRPSAPGMARARGRKSVYGQSLAEKQKIKYYYGISERQLRKLYTVAKRQKGNTGENLMVLCERRLDNVLRRAGFCKTRPQARQGIAHGHFLVNGRPTDVASFSVRPGDVISLRQKGKSKELYQLIAETEANPNIPWLDVDKKDMVVKVTSLPMPEDFTLPVEIGLVIEFLAR